MNVFQVPFGMRFLDDGSWRRLMVKVVRMEKVKGHVLAGFTGMAGRRPKKKSNAGLRKVSVLRRGCPKINQFHLA